MNFDLLRVQMLPAHYQQESRMAIKVRFRLCTLSAGMCTSLKTNIAMTHDHSHN